MNKINIDISQVELSTIKDFLSGIGEDISKYTEPGLRARYKMFLIQHRAREEFFKGVDNNA